MSNGQGGGSDPLHNTKGAGNDHRSNVKGGDKKSSKGGSSLRGAGTPFGGS